MGRWIACGRRGAAPHLVKQRLIRKLARKFETPIFIETGTYLGDMCLAMRRRFRSIYSIELDERLYHRAENLFAGHDHVTLLQGDSAAMLPQVLAQVEDPCLFWLDGHYSGGVTARSSQDFPIIDELNHIGLHEVDAHVVLIDDVRTFTGTRGAPALGDVLEAGKAAFPRHELAITNDVIVFTP